MKRLFLILLYGLVFSHLLRAETPTDVIPKDSLPNLWIVCIDMSASMASCKELPSIPDLVQSFLACDSLKGENDVYILQKSGADKDRLLKANENNKAYNDNDLVSDLIHDRQVFGRLEDLMATLRQIVASRSSFGFNMSFTSLVRPLSIYELTMNHDVDFIKFNKVYHVLITDDGDINDQWMQDYKWMKKWAIKHFRRYNEILPTIACSEFDFSSRRSGKFVEIQASDQQQPRVYLTQYITYQDIHPNRALPADSLIAVSDFHDHCLILSMPSCDSTINMLYVNSCLVNDNAIPIDRYLYRGDSLNVEYDKSYVKARRNRIAVDGSYQETYQDSVLGLRYRTVDIAEGALNDSFVTIENKAKDFHRLCLLLGLLVVAIIAFFIWRDLDVLEIFANGKHWSIKRKAMDRLRNDAYVLLKVIYDETSVTDALFFNGYGVTVKNDKTQKGGKTLVIKSKFRSLAPTYNNVQHYENASNTEITIDFNDDRPDKKVAFPYASWLSHDLVIQFEPKSLPVREEAGNPLRERNLNMLAHWYEMHRKQISTTYNNMMVNVIGKEVMGDHNNKDYAILNIFDLNGQNSAGHIYLRYSLACHFDSGRNSVQQVTDRLINIGLGVLKKERQRKGFVGRAANVESQWTDSVVLVDVSPMLSYLYLIDNRSGRSRMAYSPFSDGDLELKAKTVRLYPNSDMTLLNLPIKQTHLKGMIDWPMTLHLRRCRRKSGVMSFLGSDEVSLLGSTMNCSYGTKSFELNAVNDDYFWAINHLLFEKHKQ